MKSVRSLLSLLALMAAPGLTACDGSDPTSGANVGSVKFTTWGEDYIEEGIGADPSGEDGFVDGWSIKYEKFLVHFSSIIVADGSGKVGAELAGSRFVDNVRPGAKELATFQGLDAKAWDDVSYSIAPATADAVVVAGDPADLAMMVKEGYSLYVAGTATRVEGGATLTKAFRWGFSATSRYTDCRSEQDGKHLRGVVVKTGGADLVELTTHGDHLFYDRLQASPDPAVPTSLRFEALARADDAPHGDGDGEVSLAELDQRPIDVTKYDPSGLDAPTLGAFVRALVRTVGHYRGEGECTTSRAP
jgi:hypothetical protein